MNALIATLLALATVAGIAAVPAPLATHAALDPSCQSVDGVGTICTDVDADCTDGSCGASASGDIGIGTRAATCQNVGGVADVCQDGDASSGSVDASFGAAGAQGTAHAEYETGA